MAGLGTHVPHAGCPPTCICHAVVEVCPHIAALVGMPRNYAPTCIGHCERSGELVHGGHGLIRAKLDLDAVSFHKTNCMHG